MNNSNMLFDKTSCFVFAVVFLLSLVLRVYHVALVPVIVHDEAITYLAVTGHEGEYAEMEKNRTAPYAQWVPVSTWKRYLEVEDKYIFSKIKNELINYDVHPPLYFWLLHCWVVLVGVHTWSGPSLNIVLSILNVFLLLQIGKLTLKNKNEILFVVIAYLLSPGVWSATFIARNYELYTLLTLLLFLYVLRYIQSKDRGIIFIFTISFLIYLGAMTHYYFALMAASSALIPVVAVFLVGTLSLREGIRKVLGIFSAVFLSILVFFATNAGFVQQVTSFESQGQVFSFISFVLRCLKTGLVFPGFFVEVNRASISIVSIISFVLFCLFFLIKIVLQRDSEGGRLGDIPEKVAGLFYPCMFFLGASIMQILLYISFFTHQAVMGPRYFAPLYPFFAFFPLLLFRLFSVEINRRDVLVYSTLFFFSACLYTHPWKTYHSDSTALLFRANKILIDNTRRGVLLKNIINIPDEKLVYCAMQDDLLYSEDLPADLNEGDLYFSHLMHGNTGKKRNYILDRLKENHVVSVPKGGEWGIWGSGKLYLIGAEY